MADDDQDLDAALAAFMDAAPVGLGFWDSDGVPRRRNGVVERLDGLLEPVLAEVLDGGGRVEDRPFSIDGRHYVVTAFPVNGGVGIAVVDDTERQLAVERERRDRRRIEGLWRVSVALTAVTGAEAVLQALARAAVPDLADWCSIDVLNPGGGVHRAAIAHTFPELEGLAAELRTRFPGTQQAIEDVIRTGEPRVRPRMRDEIREALGLHAVVIVPLRSRGAVLGSLSLALTDPDRAWNDDMIATAEALASQAAVALDGARLHEERRRIAEVWQRSVLPELPAVPGASVGARYRPAGRSNLVGGDFYAIFPGGDGAFRLLIGDVAGKGPDAAELTSFLRHSAQVAALDERDPARELATLNRALLSRQDRFCSAVLADVSREPDGAGLRLRVACAGHPSPLVVHGDGRVEEVDVTGTLLGVFDEPRLGCTEVVLAPGDAMVLFTDGATELRGSSVRDSTASLMHTLREASGGDAVALAQAVEHHALVRTGGELRDDLAALVIRAD